MMTRYFAKCRHLRHIPPLECTTAAAVWLFSCFSAASSFWGKHTVHGVNSTPSTGNSVMNTSQHHHIFEIGCPRSWSQQPALGLGGLPSTFTSIEFSFGLSHKRYSSALSHLFLGWVILCLHHHSTREHKGLYTLRCACSVRADLLNAHWSKQPKWLGSATISVEQRIHTRRSKPWCAKAGRWKWNTRVRDAWANCPTTVTLSGNPLLPPPPNQPFRRGCVIFPWDGTSESFSLGTLCTEIMKNDSSCSVNQMPHLWATDRSKHKPMSMGSFFFFFFWEGSTAVYRLCWKHFWQMRHSGVISRRDETLGVPLEGNVWWKRHADLTKVPVPLKLSLWLACSNHVSQGE